MNKRALLLFTFLLAIPAFMMAASVGDKVDGYVLLDNGRKIDGKVIIGTLIENEMMVRFIPKGKNNQIVYSPKEVEAYGFELAEMNDLGQKTKTKIEYQRKKVDYPPKPFASTLVFLQVVEQGTVNLFSYFVEMRSNKQHPLQYHFYMEKEDGLLVKVDLDSFEQITKSTFRDYTALSSRIGGEDFMFRDLEQMVRDFNFWVINKHDKNEYRIAMKGEERSSNREESEFE